MGRCKACGNQLLTSVSKSRGECLDCFGEDTPTPDPKMGTASPQEAFDPSAGGRKNGKVRMELVFQGMPNALLELGKVMTWALEGKGYKEGDFLLVPDAVTKYRGAMLRHDLKEAMGQMHDDESGLVHAVHTAWNAMAKLEILLREQAQ